MVRTPSFSERKSERTDEREGRHPGDTVPKSLATVLEKRLLLIFTGNEVQRDKSDDCGHLSNASNGVGRGGLFEKQLPFSMNFGFRSSSELQGEVDPTGELVAF